MNGERIVVVGASLAGLRGAEALRDEGFTGPITVIGDETRPPYDRPPLSKQVLTGWAAPERTALPCLTDLEPIEWRFGVPATALDRDDKEVVLADGSRVPYDKLLIATGVRNRPWPHAEQAEFDGIFSIRTGADARGLRDRLDRGPKRVVVIGAGFTGSEVASICRGRGHEVTVLERGARPLAGALGAALGEVAAEMQREAGVDLRCGVAVEALQGTDGRLTGVALADGSEIEADVAVVALGAIRNTEWLADSGLAAGPLGLSVDAGCRAYQVDGLIDDDIFAAGDVARFPHALFDYQFLALEHWENAVVGARIAAHNMICAPRARRAHVSVPAFWSVQFETNIKSVGVPTLADQIVLAQGSLERHRFAAVYGREGRVIAAVTFDHGRYLEHYRALIRTAAPISSLPALAEGELPDDPGFAGMPAYHLPTVIVTGHSPTTMEAYRVPAEAPAAAS
jgi:3-phenylpropionate/trans-cinnamate dioxygenase ferredoxin reductase component